MTHTDITQTDDWKKAVAFHGHVCPGLSIGFKAAVAALKWLKEHRASDEELVAVVETNACGVDAVQTLTGCTFGKGNLVHKDYGKQAFTFVSRKSGEGVRVSLRPGVLELSERHKELLGKIRTEEASQADREEFWSIHRARSIELLNLDDNAMFTVTPTSVALPPKAQIEPSKACDVCGEPVMASMLTETGDSGFVCRACRQ